MSALRFGTIILSAEDARERTLSELAALIRQTWPKVYFGAVPYLQAMATLDSVEDSYGLDSAASIIRYFLANASTYRGDVARVVKAELKRRIAGRY